MTLGPPFGIVTTGPYSTLKDDPVVKPGPSTDVAPIRPDRISGQESEVDLSPKRMSERRIDNSSKPLAPGIHHDLDPRSPLRPGAVTQALSVPPIGATGTQLAEQPAGTLSWITPPVETFENCYQQAVFSDANYFTSSNVWVDAPPYGTWTVTLPYTKTYMLEVDISLYWTVKDPASGNVNFRARCNGVSVYMGILHRPSTGDLTRKFMHMMAPAALIAGVNTISMQWQVAGTTTVNAEALKDRVYYTLFG